MPEGGVAFGSWAAGEGFDNWGVGSSVWAGLMGSALVVVLFAASSVRARGRPGANGPLGTR